MHGLGLWDWDEDQATEVSDHNKKGRPLSTETILYEKAPLGSLASIEAFPFLGIGASLARRGNRQTAPCFTAARQHLYDVTRELIDIAKHHQLLSSQICPRDGGGDLGSV